MKVTKSQVVAALDKAGFHNASSWSLEKLQDKVNSLAEAQDIEKDVRKLQDKEAKALLLKILKANEDEVEVEVTEDGPKVKGTGPGVKGAVGKKAAKDDFEDEDNEDEDNEDEDEEDSDSGDEDEEDSDESDDSDEEDDEMETKTKAKASAKGKPDAKAEKKTKPAAPAKEKKAPAEVDDFGCRLGTRAARLNAAITGKWKSAKQIMEDAKYDKPISGHLRKFIGLGKVERNEEDGTYRRVGAAKEKDAPKKKTVKK